MTVKLLDRALDALAALRTERAALTRALEESKILTARVIVQRFWSCGTLPRLADAEFKVFSQFGDDGIIQYLLRTVGPLVDRFIEFGVEDYQEANTRFLLMNNDWSGLVIDGSARNVARIRAQEWYWQHELAALSALVDRDNVNDLFRSSGFTGEIGLLSVDIDGNDYWVWEAVDCVDPVITVCEYNAVFGAAAPVTVPYQPAFQRTRAHPSNLYWGSSLRALCHLAERKGLAFVGANSAGNNAYFVKRDRLGALRALTAEEGFVDSKFRESRDDAGRFTFLRGEARRKAIGKMPLVDVVTGKTLQVGELVG